MVVLLLSGCMRCTTDCRVCKLRYVLVRKVVMARTSWVGLQQDNQRQKQRRVVANLDRRLSHQLSAQDAPIMLCCGPCLFGYALESAHVPLLDRPIRLRTC
jgi:hypothetical protein